MPAIEWRQQWKPLAAITAVLLAFFYVPPEAIGLSGPLLEALALTQWYAREHVLLCLVPAFFIAGAIAVFVSRTSVMKYLGAGANKVLAYGVASVSGTILAVCSCTVLPLFAGIHRMGAGLGPAVAFLYSGPAINVLAVILTARVLGVELGIARAVGAIVFSIVIGLAMHLLFAREESEQARLAAALPEAKAGRPLWQTGLYFAAMVAILVFANWSDTGASGGLWFWIARYKWWLTSAAALGLGLCLVLWFRLGWLSVVVTGLAAAALAVLFPEEPMVAFTAAVIGLSLILNQRDDEGGDWLAQTWGLAKQILPLLLVGVLAAGLLLGRPGGEGLIPSAWIARAVGGNSIEANLFASVVGAFMYFATLTEVPILQGLIGNGMGKGPALALLLAGPALSLPNMLVIRSVLGTRKTLAFVILVVVFATASGFLYGAMF